MLLAVVIVWQVPASTGEFESSMSVHAQTREHALILRSMVLVCLFTN